MPCLLVSIILRETTLISYFPLDTQFRKGSNIFIVIFQRNCIRNQRVAQGGKEAFYGDINYRKQCKLSILTSPYLLSAYLLDKSAWGQFLSVGVL